MDTQQLKLLAGLVRGLLQPSHPSLGHGQSLDLIAALPGLRNWPEVLAFPDRVAATELDTTSTSRLAFRLKKRFAVDMSPQELLEALSPPALSSPGAHPTFGRRVPFPACTSRRRRTRSTLCWKRTRTSPTAL
ncbi:hypothetical protein [Cupriavidus sp. D39]|uniref:hypothetical protein n=1 Tax=Cupriavidus sp. D39 TaxID=2997877 RepID=UPI00226E1312|nr:hypothetical protein [Cupriavidus sp. D39]MCY0852990.1 hypothetical protein [Cupriavidus sp. D39]